MTHISKQGSTEMTDFEKVKNYEENIKKDDVKNKAESTPPRGSEEKPQPYLVRLSTLLGSQLSMYGILAL